MSRISKRAEQNRKAQQAFRKRRDAYIQQLQDTVQEMDILKSRSLSAEARYEEAKKVAEALRIENAVLREVVLGAAEHGAGIIDSDGEFLVVRNSQSHLGGTQTDVGTSAARNEAEHEQQGIHGQAERTLGDGGKNHSVAVEDVQAALDRLASKTAILAKTGLPAI